MFTVKSLSGGKCCHQNRIRIKLSWTRIRGASALLWADWNSLKFDWTSNPRGPRRTCGSRGPGTSHTRPHQSGRLRPRKKQATSSARAKSNPKPYFGHRPQKGLAQDSKTQLAILHTSQYGTLMTVWITTASMCPFKRRWSVNQSNNPTSLLRFENQCVHDRLH